MKSCKARGVLPIKDTSQAHIMQAVSTYISDEDLKIVQSVLKQNKSIGHNSNDADDEQEPKKNNAREMRSSQFTKMIDDRISNKSRKRKASDISVQYIEVLCRFNNKVPISYFSRKNTLQARNNGPWYNTRRCQRDEESYRIQMFTGST